MMMVRILTGWLGLLSVAVALLSGAALGWFYSPEPGSAHASVVELESLLVTGRWLRSVHGLASQAALALGLLHFAAVIWRRPGGAEPSPGPPPGWASGIWALGLVGVLAFGGRALLWDQHAGTSLIMAERLLAAGEVRPLASLLGPVPGPLLLPRLWLLHLLASLGLVSLLAVHLPWRERCRRWIVEAAAGKRALLVGGVGSLALLGGGLLWRVPPGAAFLAEADPGLPQSAEWYLRWLQLLSLRSRPAALLVLALLVLLASLTPLFTGARGRRSLRLLWAGALSLLLLLSLLPSS